MDKSYIIAQLVFDIFIIAALFRQFNLIHSVIDSSITLSKQINKFMKSAVTVAPDALAVPTVTTPPAPRECTMSLSGVHTFEYRRNHNTGVYTMTCRACGTEKLA